MSRFAHGLVIGKFYPPHNGHHLLISTAAEQVERLSVVVTAHPHESIPVGDRVSWLVATHAGEPNVRIVGAINTNPVDFDDDEIWSRHVAVFRGAVGAAPVDAVFSSEAYGEELARRFGAVHVAVDVDRSGVPISGTAVRADPAGNWHHLAPATRAGLAVRMRARPADIAALGLATGGDGPVIVVPDRDAPPVTRADIKAACARAWDFAPPW